MTEPPRIPSSPSPYNNLIVSSILIYQYGIPAELAKPSAIPVLCQSLPASSSEDELLFFRQGSLTSLPSLNITRPPPHLKVYFHSQHRTDGTIEAVPNSPHFCFYSILSTWLAVNDWCALYCTALHGTCKADSGGARTVLSQSPL